VPAAVAEEAADTTGRRMQEHAMQPASEVCRSTGRVEATTSQEHLMPPDGVWRKSEHYLPTRASCLVPWIRVLSGAQNTPTFWVITEVPW